MSRLGGTTLLCLACILFVAAPSWGAAEAFFEYFYIEASSGSSAGGHAAIRFGDDVYHFQYAEPGIIRPALESWTSFDLSYRGLDNRPIHVQRIAVSSATYERLRRAFHRRYVVQESQVRLLEALGREIDLLTCLAEADSQRAAPCQIHLPGAGYFSASQPAIPSPPVASSSVAAEALDEARRRVEGLMTTDGLDQRVRALSSRIERLAPEEVSVDTPRAGIVSLPPPLLGDEYRNLLLELLALRALSGQAPPNELAFRVLPGTLTEEQRAVLRRRESRQRDRIAALLHSSRPDRGYPLLIAMARLVSFHVSARSGRLTVLDTFADDTPTASLAAVRDLPALEEIREERRQELQAALEAAFSASADDEVSWSRFEVAANVALELEEAIANDRPLRSHQATLVPARGAPVAAEWPAPRLTRAAAETALERARRAQRETKERLLELYRYDLIRRNCVTEIFRTIDAVDDADEAFERPGLVVRNTKFIPFVSAKAVRESYPVTEQFVLPSYRQERLNRMRSGPRRWSSLLRESVSLTSTIAPVDFDQDAFLAFSSGTFFLRPLVGTANVVFGSGAILAGMVAAPFDHGTLLAAGANGVLYSLPELAFVNIRKGTAPLLPSSWDTAEQ